MRTKHTRHNVRVIENKKIDREDEQKAPLMLTIDETAEKSGISAFTIRTWVKRGMCPYIKIGRKYLISWSNFCNFLNSNMGENREAVR